MWLLRRPVSTTVFAIFLSVGLWFWLKGAAHIEDFNRVAYAPLWTGQVDLSSVTKLTATFDNSFPAGHGGSIKLEVLDETETELPSLPARVFVLSTEESFELELYGVDLSVMDWAANRSGMDTRFIGEKWGTLPFDDALTIEVAFEPIDDTVAPGPRRVEIWAGVCGLEMLGGRVLQALGVGSGIVALIGAIAGLRPRKPQAQP